MNLLQEIHQPPFAMRGPSIYTAQPNTQQTGWRISIVAARIRQILIPEEVEPFRSIATVRGLRGREALSGDVRPAALFVIRQSARWRSR